ncbi:unnamed protein product [Oreochromis niloticus]|nr:unnamed protein product [Mustela putorius furo]
MPATPAKVPKYNGLTPLEPYLSQVRLAARHNGWNDEEAATHLALALEGDALQVLLDLAPSEQHELQALTIALERRFGQQHSTDQSREQLTNWSLTGERTDMRGKKPLRIRVKDLELVHDFWLADIQDQCIIGLDLLTRWGACVDTAKLAITLGTETLALQCGQKQGTRDCRQTRLVQHTIDTGFAQPICLRPRQLPLAKRQGERAQEARGVATARATAGGGGWLSLTMQQLKQEQEADATLCGHWRGLAKVVGRLTEVVYRIRMPGLGRMAVLHQDRLSPYCPPAPAAAGAGDAGGTPGSHPSDSSPAGRDQPARRRKTHGHLQDFVLGNGVVGDD